MEQREAGFEADRLREHGRALRKAAQELAEATQHALADAEQIARSEVRTRPYGVLGVAFAAGWILGGGLPVRLAALASSALGRAALGLAAARLADGGAFSRSGNSGTPGPTGFDA